MQLGLAAWHRFIASGDAELLADLLAEDVVFLSPISDEPQHGRDALMAYMLAAIQVFGSKSGIRYVRELTNGSEVSLEFEASLDGTAINGVDLIQFDLEGRIIDFRAFIRPLNAATLLKERLAAQLHTA